MDYYSKYIKYKNKYIHLKKQMGGGFINIGELLEKYNKEKEYINVIPRSEFIINADEIKIGESLQKIFIFLDNVIKNKKNIISIFDNIFTQDLTKSYYDDNEDIESIIRIMKMVVNLPLLKNIFNKESINDNIKALYEMLILPLLDGDNISDNISQKRKEYMDLYNNTIKLFNECKTSGDSFIIHYKKNNLQMQMNVNVVTYDGVKMAEHIYIFKYPSSIIYKLFGESQPSISYFLHLHSIIHFKLKYIITFPLGSISFVFKTFEDFGMINNLTKKEEGFKQTEKTKEIISVAATNKHNNIFCNYPTYLYEILDFPIVTDL